MPAPRLQRAARLAVSLTAREAPGGVVVVVQVRGRTLQLGALPRARALEAARIATPPHAAAATMSYLHYGRSAAA